LNLIELTDLPEELDLDARWHQVLARLKERLGRRPDMNAILFLIGIQELGQGVGDFTKEQKQDLMHIATCRLLSISGYYELENVDADGWPHYRNLKPVAFATLRDQERLLRWHIIEYFGETEW
jgi:hypothetical protein